MVVQPQAVFVVLLVAIALNLAIMAALIVVPVVRRAARRDRGEASPPADPLLDSARAGFGTALSEDPGRDPRDRDGPRTDAHRTTDDVPHQSRPVAAESAPRVVEDAGAPDAPDTDPALGGPGTVDGAPVGSASADPATADEDGAGDAPVVPPVTADPPPVAPGTGDSRPVAPGTAAEPDAPTRTHRRGRRFRVPAHDDPRTSRAIQSFIDRRSFVRDDSREPGASRGRHDARLAHDALGGGARRGDQSGMGGIGSDRRRVGEAQGHVPPGSSTPSGPLRGRDAFNAAPASRDAGPARSTGRPPVGRGGAFDAIWPVDPLTGLGNRLAWEALVASEARLLAATEPASVIVVEVEVAAGLADVGTRPADAGRGRPDDLSAGPADAGRGRPDAAPSGAASSGGSAAWMPAVAGALRSELRSSDLLARLAPTFVAGLLAGTSGDQALVVVERVRRVAEESLSSRRTAFRVRAGAADVAACGGIDAALREATRRARLGEGAR